MFKVINPSNCPILNFGRARKPLKEVGGELFPIPKRSGDLNPIENVFNVAKEELRTQAITFNLAYESFEVFAREKSTMYSMPRDIIDNTIASMFKALTFNQKK